MSGSCLRDVECFNIRRTVPAPVVMAETDVCVNAPFESVICALRTTWACKVHLFFRLIHPRLSTYELDPILRFLLVQSLKVVIP